GGSYRPCCSISERTNGVTFNLTLDFPKQIYIPHGAFSVFDFVQDFFHPSCSFPARRTLTATFMAIEPCKGKRMSNHTLIFIQYDKTSRTHHGTGLETTVGKAFIIHVTRLSFCCFQQEVGRKDGYR